jgi:phosphoglycolate phosphatase
MLAPSERTPDLAGWTIVFDLDGTLVETAPDLLEALNHTLSGELSSPVKLDAIRPMIGHGARAMLEHALVAEGIAHDDAGLDARLRRFLAYYEANIAEHSRPFEGVEVALARLIERGARLSVCTNKTQALSERLLGALGLDTLFSAIVGADVIPRRKPDAGHVHAAIIRAGGSASRAIMIGDSRTDERAARNAGLAFIFVPFGYEAESASAMAADAILEDYSRLDALIATLIS